MFSILSGFVPQQHFSNLLILQVFAMARHLRNRPETVKKPLQTKRHLTEVLGFTGGGLGGWKSNAHRDDVFSPQNIQVFYVFFGSQLLGEVMFGGGKKEPEDATLNKYSSEAHGFFCGPSPHGGPRNRKMNFLGNLYRKQGLPPKWHHAIARGTSHMNVFFCAV